MSELLNKKHAKKTKAKTAAVKTEAKKNDVETELKLAVNDVLIFAKEHLEADRLDEAEKIYQEVLTIDPENAVANHDLGVIEAVNKGIPAALPYFKRAVQFNAQCEQYWVTYFDALVMNEDLEGAKVALEIGQVYGLTAETTKVLAEEIGLEYVAAAD